MEKGRRYKEESRKREEIEFGGEMALSAESETSSLTTRRVTNTGSTSTGSVLTCDSSAFLHFTLKLSSKWKYRAIRRAIIRLRQSSGSGEVGIAQASEGNILSIGTERNYVDEETDGSGNTYRIADITWLIAKNPCASIYFAMVSYDGGFAAYIRRARRTD